MECSILSSLKLSKQKHNDDLNRRGSKRRALTYARRDLLDTKPSELSVASSNSSNDVDLNFIRIDDSQNLSLCNDTSDSSLNETVPNDIVELSIHEIVYDNISEVSVDEESFTTLDEYFDFSLFTTEPDISLHNLTNVTKNEYCKALLNLFRDANVCKTHCDRFIQLISSGLPTPNHMPKSTKALLNEMQGECFSITLYMHTNSLNLVFQSIYFDNEEEIALCLAPKKCKNLSNKDDRLKSIENKMDDFNQCMKKMSHSMRQMASYSNKITSRNLDIYRDPNSQEKFTDKVDHNGTNLVTIVGRDFGDFAREVMRVLYSEEERKTHILPPGRPHLFRKPLDSNRFALLNDAVRVKYRLSKHLYDDFFKYHLRPKLSDFLVEERRRESNKIVRNQAKSIVSQIATQSQPGEE
ncbi:unnamed protein product [Rotaria magnacalcarata]|uniref:Uncharacterized protein n=2 Tax=Rotaria magnacalcarata TaxID=392030 RepID=A0A816R9S4_9BILA|nr:unnamed protein product [Rotaria magnacalcarata]